MPVLSADAAGEDTSHRGRLSPEREASLSINPQNDQRFWVKSRNAEPARRYTDHSVIGAAPSFS